MLAHPLEVDEADITRFAKIYPIALFVAPVLVLISYVVGPKPMDLQLIHARRKACSAQFQN